MEPKPKWRLHKIALWLLLVVALAFIAHVPQRIYFVFNGRTIESNGGEAKEYLQKYIGTTAAARVNEVQFLDKRYMPGVRFQWFTFKCDTIAFQAISQNLSSDSGYTVIDSGVISITPRHGEYYYVLNDDEGLIREDRNREPEWWPNPQMMSGLHAIHVQRDEAVDWSYLWYYYDELHNVCWLEIKS